MVNSISRHYLLRGRATLPVKLMCLLKESSRRPSRQFGQNCCRWRELAETTASLPLVVTRCWQFKSSRNFTLLVTRSRQAFFLSHPPYRHSRMPSDSTVPLLFPPTSSRPMSLASLLRCCL